jgi:hypothetical protein
VSDLKLTEERVFILYKDILSAVSPNMSIKEIAKSVTKGNGKCYSKVWVGRLLADFEALGLVQRKINERKCVRYERTAKGDRLLKAESLDQIKKR